MRNSSQIVGDLNRKITRFSRTRVQICWCDELFEKRVEDLKKHLLNRNYNLGVINKAKERIRSVSREEALKKVSREKEKRKCFITEYHPSLPPMGQVLKKHWSVMVERDRRLKDVFPRQSMVAYKRGQSLRDLLCRAKLPNTSRKSKRQSSKQGFTNCGQLCVLCPFARTSKSHRVDGREFQINGLIICSTMGCVYKIQCDKCQTLYNMERQGGNSERDSGSTKETSWIQEPNQYLNTSTCQVMVLRTWHLWE